MQLEYFRAFHLLGVERFRLIQLLFQHRFLPVFFYFHLLGLLVSVQRIFNKQEQLN